MPVPAKAGIGERDHGLGTLDPDGSDEQAHALLLLGEHMLHFLPGCAILCGCHGP